MEARHAKYLEFDPFLDCDRDLDIRGRQVAIVKTRSIQKCVTPNGSHDMPKGTTARMERAFVDNRLGRYYSCLACCDRMMAKADELKAEGEGQ